MKIEIDLNTPNGPIVEYGPDDDAQSVEDYIPVGWRVDWETPAYKLTSGRYRAPLVLTAAITRECRSCVYVPDSYEVDAEGRCTNCKDTKIEAVTDCDGCDSPQPDLKLYLVTFDDDAEQEVYYCDDCAELARMNWNGETKSIAPITPKPEG